MLKRLGVFKTVFYQHHLRLLTRSPDRMVQEQALADITQALAHDEEISRLLRRHSASAAVIGELYRFLLAHGANIWVHGNYVAAACLCNPLIVEAYLRDRQHRFDEAFGRGFADICVRYIEGGYGENFLRDMLDITTPRAARA
jgi:Flp pilus assembly protein TadB